ncbi:hypothetical protein As57867_005163, partial [Aphanomyces stellatus]
MCFSHGGYFKRASLSAHCGTLICTPVSLNLHTPRAHFASAMSTDFAELKSPSQDEAPWSQRRHPLEAAGWFSYATVSWLDALVWKGYKTPLSEGDVWPLAYADSAEALSAQMEPYWKNSNLTMVILRAFRYRIVVSFSLYGVYAAVSLIQPIAVKSLMQFLNNAPSTDLGITNGYVLALLLFVISLLAPTLMDFAAFYAYHISMNLKCVLSHVVYKKTLTLSSTAKTKFSSGEVVTMSSVDQDRIALGLGLSHWTFISPAFLLVIFIMLGFELGVLAALVGGIVMALFVAVGYVTGSKVGLLRRDILQVQAERVKLTNEVLQGIRVVKLYAWEVAIQNQLHDIRQRELACLTKYHALRIANLVALMIAPVVSLTLCLMVHVARGHSLDITTAFTALAYMNITRQPCGVFSTSVIGFTEGMASCRRINDYLDADEKDDELDNVPTTLTSGSVELTAADFSWGHDITLKQINLSIKPNTLTMVVGSVGCGKSSLLSAILGDIHLTGGSREVQARFSYVNQESWIQHATVKQNILFESPLDEELYNRVVSACQLLPDLEMLPK